MRHPTTKLIIAFVVALGVGYAAAYGIMSFVLDTPMRLFGFGNLTLIALLVALLLMVWLDQPLDLGLFAWSPNAKTDRKSDEKDSVPSEPQVPRSGGFPHDIPSEHWNADYGDSKQVYQGAELPIWILAGWTIFILWAIVYLISGLPTFHY